MARQARERPAVGWREWVSLPELGVDAVKAKVDTGARTSALHAFDVEEYDDGEQRMVRFKVHPIQRDSHHTVEAAALLVDRRVVRNPGRGAREELRPVISTEVQVGDERYPIELTLTRRDAMGFRMLLGRQAIRGRFVVDPGKSFMFSADQRKKKQ